uniref:Uncharacterized protein n=1 Tax=Vitis vinifera TaxID=29760 RepID=A5BBE8_VITVI|nr:hypothetical protein VITISV_025951 [Vitis vinifera]
MKGFNSTTWERGVGFSGIEVGSDWQIFLPASLKHRHICQNHWLSPNFFAFFLATLGSTGWRVRRAKRRRFSSAGIPAGRGERGEWGVLAGLQGLASGLDDSGRKKKKEIEPDDSERTVRFIRFAGWTFGLADPILGRPLFRSNWPDWTGIVAGRRSDWPWYAHASTQGFWHGFESPQQQEKCERAWGLGRLAAGLAPLGIGLKHLAKILGNFPKYQQKCR